MRDGMGSVYILVTFRHTSRRVPVTRVFQESLEHINRWHSLTARGERERREGGRMGGRERGAWRGALLAGVSKSRLFTAQMT